MTKEHCNICDRAPAELKWRLWPGTLPEAHPLRNVCVDVVLIPSPRHHNTEDNDFHLCESCFKGLMDSVVEWLGGLSARREKARLEEAKV